jgi:ATP-dependent Clp protease ATP-binding subunit ClpA
VFEKFTEGGRQVVALAQEEARLLNHNYIGTEHLLLALVRETEGVAVRILLECGVDADQVRAAIASPASRPGRTARVGLVSDGAERSEDVERSWLGGLAPILPRLQRDIARELARMPDSGDLLLALATAPDTRAAAALRALGVDLDALARTVRETRAGSDPSIAELIRAIDTASAARQSAVARQDYEAAARLRDEERRLQTALTAARIGSEQIEAIRAGLGLPQRPPPGG